MAQRLKNLPPFPYWACLALGALTLTCGIFDAFKGNDVFAVGEGLLCLFWAAMAQIPTGA